MNDSTNRAPAIIITAVDQANDHREAIAALSEALGGARLFHAVGGPKAASVEDVIANPDTALDTIIPQSRKTAPPMRGQLSSLVPAIRISTSVSLP